jgi:hypothetical protein
MLLLIGQNSTFLVVPQSEFTSREPQEVYSGFQRCPTRDEISFPVGQSNRKKGQHKYACNCFIIFQCYYLYIKILKFDENFYHFEIAKLIRLIQYNKHNYLNYIYNKIDLDKQEN